MNVAVFGSTGMIGQGVIREALSASDVDRVVVVVRKATGLSHPKLTELIHDDFGDFSSKESEFRDVDVCFYCLGVSATGMNEADYRRVTYDFAVAAASTLSRANPAMTFIFVSGAGTDGTGKGRVMWARVKGETENAIKRLPFSGAYMFRPALIRPVHGERSKTTSYRVLYAAIGWLLPVLRWLAPKYVTTTEEVARAMLHVARDGAPDAVLENVAIVKLGSLPTS